MPGVAFLTLPMSCAAAVFRPLRSRVPVTSSTMMKIAMLRFETNEVPSVVRKPSAPMPPTSAVTTAATMMIRIASSLRAKPTITITIPKSTR